MIFYNVPEKNLWIISLIVTHRTLNCTLRRHCTERMPATRQRTPATIARRKKFLLKVLRWIKYINFLTEAILLLVNNDSDALKLFFNHH